MKLSHLHVLNYRGLKDVSIPLSSFICITGENNAGKSSILQSLSLFLSGSALKRTDYFDTTLPISITVTLSEVTPEDLKLLADDHRARIAALVENNKLTLVRLYNPDGKMQLGYNGVFPKDLRFSPDNVATLIAGKTGTALKTTVLTVFPELAEQIKASSTQSAIRDLIHQYGEELPNEQKAVQFRSLPIGIDKGIIPMLPERIYIPAVKDFADETKTGESSSFGKILAIVMKEIEPLLEKETTFIGELSKLLTRLPGTDGKMEDGRLNKIKIIEQTIQRYVQESFASVSLEIEIPPPELKSILATARLIADDGVRGPLEFKGDGLRRAVVFSILRAYVELARESTKETALVEGQSERGYLLLFEEPELFLHPDAQKILFDALGVFSKKHHVVVTTHSPLFLGPEVTATFIRLSKVPAEGTTKPCTKACHIDLTGSDPRDEFQIICFENNSAAFFSKRIVLVEGDCDFIAFPHIAKTLNEEWNCRSRSVAFIRVGGKGSFARYRSFFEKFDVPVFVITDLDCLDDSFDKLNPSDRAKTLRANLNEMADAANAAAMIEPKIKTDGINRMHADTKSRPLWEAVRAAYKSYKADRSKMVELDTAVEDFFEWEKKNIRRDCIREAKQPEVLAAKLELIWELRKQDVFVLERGDLESYYGGEYLGSGKTEKALAFVKKFNTRDKILALNFERACPETGMYITEFDYLCSSIFE